MAERKRNLKESGLRSGDRNGAICTTVPSAICTTDLQW
jgi:hypothetical protein